MTLPNQPSAPADVLGNQEFFRILQDIESAGSIFEIDVPTSAIYIGPNSDISEVRLTYYDKQTRGAGATNLQQVADISVNGPFIGRLNALMATQYPGTGQLARILAYPVDIVDPAYVRPTGAGAAPARRANVPPKIDLICSTAPLPETPNVRADRTYRFPRVPFNNDAGGADDGSTDLVIPIYGRRMVTIQIVCPVLTGYLATFYIAALQPGQSTFPKVLGQIGRGSSSISITDSVVYRASDQYNLDQIVGTGTTADPIMPTYDYTENAGLPLPPCKGMADLLIINIAPAFVPPPPPGYSTVDIFVKVSDREL